MKWIEVSLSVDGEAAEAVSDLLQEYGYQGVAIEQEGIMPEAWDEDNVPPATRLTVRAYLPDDETAPQQMQRLKTALGHMSLMYPMPQPAFYPVDDKDWAEAWKVHYKPVRLGKRLFIRPRWITDVETSPDDVVIALDPGMAFGTGTHPSTQLCLQALEDVLKPGSVVLDLGCGSGILAIAAAKLGAAHIHALDIDPIAVQVTQDNAHDNGVAPQITALHGSLDSLLTSARRFDLALVNILARIIIQMCDNHLGEVVRPGGRAIFGGLTLEQADAVEAALRKTGLVPAKRRVQPDGDWVVIEAYRPHDDD
ncbi:MAG: 50S ribosomal protein L11 methyltransferase [Chloroflexi bacterium]|nr:50S ribosomal protein L11 methyltransferase [Chloroflexota bacterium]